MSAHERLRSARQSRLSAPERLPSAREPRPSAAAQYLPARPAAAPTRPYPDNLPAAAASYVRQHYFRRLPSTLSMTPATRPSVAGELWPLDDSPATQ
jgi:hypothetical protein